MTDNAWVTESARVGGNAWITDTALISGSTKVADNAWVADDAQVAGSAWVVGSAWITSTRHVLSISAVDVIGNVVTIHRHYDGPTSSVWGHLAVTTTWRGPIDGLAERLNGSDRAGILALDYHRIAEWVSEPLTDADHERWAKRLAETGGVAR